MISIKPKLFVSVKIRPITNKKVRANSALKDLELGLVKVSTKKVRTGMREARSVLVCQ